MCLSVCSSVRATKSAYIAIIVYYENAYGNISVILVFGDFVKISNSICLTPCGNEKESDIITIMINDGWPGI